MRRSAMVAGKPLKARTPLRAIKAWRPPRKAISARSSRRAKLYREERVPLVARMLTPPRPCELGPAFATVDPAYTGCTGTATVLHELRKRSQGGSIVNVENIRVACSRCNSHVEDEPLLAHRASLVVRRGDPGWAELGADQDAGATALAVAIYLVLVALTFAIVAYAYLQPRGW